MKYRFQHACAQCALGVNQIETCSWGEGDEFTDAQISSKGAEASLCFEVVSY